MKLFLLFFTIFCSSTLAAPVRPGMDLDILILGMAKANYAGGERTFISPGDPGGEGALYYMSWTVDQGSLTATFDGKTRKILTLFYTLNCEPTVPIGKHFPLRVERIDCATGQILIQVKEGKQKGDQPAAAGDSKPEGGKKAKSDAETPRQ